MTLEPEVVHGAALDAIHFRVIFPLGAKDTARGDYQNASPGAVQPMLKWRTQYFPRTGANEAVVLDSEASMGIALP